jgi:hypothetical protein
MALRLLVEQPAPEEEFEYIVEEQNNNKPSNLFITGPYMQCEQINKNKRVYSEREMDREVNRYISEMVKTKRAMGELNHPTKAEVDLERACHMVVDLRKEGNTYYGKSKVLSTPTGMIVRSLINDGVKIGMSSRALGKLTEESNGINRVTEFRLVAVDCVADPSCPSAFVNGILESKQFVLKEDGRLEEYFDKFSNSISSLPKKDVDSFLKEQIIEFLSKISKVL